MRQRHLWDRIAGTYNPHHADQSGARVMAAPVQKFSAKPASRFLALVGLLLCSALAHEARADSNSVALVMAVSGTTKPELSIHREIAPGTRIDLSPGARVALLHYSSCTIVAVAGGSATVTDQGIDAKPADVESRSPGPCPRVHRIIQTGPGPQGGVLVTRGEPKTYADVGASSEVILTGKSAADAVGVEVLDANRRPVDLRPTVRDGSFSLNGSLLRGRSYVFRIAFSGQREPLDVPVMISPGDPTKLLIIRFE
jgi:hypothetical protein